MFAHVTPFDAYPAGHPQVYEPAVLVHVPTPHGFDGEHSLLSTHVTPFDV
jgi:hypothetical protein